MITDHEKIHLTAARLWRTRFDQEQDLQTLAPGLVQADQVISNLLVMINRLTLDIEFLELHGFEPGRTTPATALGQARYEASLIPPDKT